MRGWFFRVFEFDTPEHTGINGLVRSHVSHLWPQLHFRCEQLSHG